MTQEIKLLINKIIGLETNTVEISMDYDKIRKEIPPTKFKEQKDLVIETKETLSNKSHNKMKVLETLGLYSTIT